MLPLLQAFKREFILVGGTAIALQIGHRKSIDFDLFKEKPLNKKRIKDKIYLSRLHSQLLFENEQGIHYIINNVKWTFFYYPFPIEGTVQYAKYIKMPDLLTLAAMKFTLPTKKIELILPRIGRPNKILTISKGFFGWRIVNLAADDKSILKIGENR